MQLTKFLVGKSASHLDDVVVEIGDQIGSLAQLADGPLQKPTTASTRRRRSRRRRRLTISKTADHDDGLTTDNLIGEEAVVVKGEEEGKFGWLEDVEFPFINVEREEEEREG